MSNTETEPALAKVGTDFWADFLGVDPYTVLGRALAVANGRHDPILPPCLPIDGPPTWLKSAAIAHIQKMGGAVESPTVGVEYFAHFYDLTPEMIRKMVRAGQRGRGYDGRICPPLDVPGQYRWLRSDAEAHVAALKACSKDGG